MSSLHTSFGTGLPVRRKFSVKPLSIMDAGYSMDATVLMQKLVEKDINTQLLIEFYEEVVENEKVFCSMVEEISHIDEIEERQKSVDHIESFCIILRELRIQYQYILGDEHLFLPEAAKREKMISNASRFIELLEKECNLEFPDTNDL
jgi:hypothetical protein